MNRRVTLRIAGAGKPRGRSAFTLMEVMIAMAIFAMAAFAILELVSSNLRNARLLETPRVDCALVMDDLIQTNQLEEGTEDGDFDTLYPGYHWEQIITAADDVVPNGDTNGLFHVTYLLRHPDGTIETNLTALLWKPQSKPIQH